MPDAPLLIDLRSFVEAHGEDPRYKLLGKLVLVAAMMAPGFVTEVSRGTA